MKVNSEMRRCDGAKSKPRVVAIGSVAKSTDDHEDQANDESDNGAHEPERLPFGWR
jgi:hypothetical protein